MTAQQLYIIGGILCLAGSIAINLIITHRFILKHKYINHSTHWRWKALLSLPACSLFTLGVWQNVKPVFALGLPAVMVAVWFMTFFDGIYGLRTASDFFYTGTATGKMKAKTDGFWRSIPRWAHIILKIVWCFITAYLYFKMIEK